MIRLVLWSTLYDDLHEAVQGFERLIVFCIAARSASSSFKKMKNGVCVFVETWSLVMEVELNARSKRHWEDSLDGETVETAQVKFKRLLGKDVFDAPDTSACIYASFPELISSIVTTNLNIQLITSSRQ